MRAVYIQERGVDLWIQHPMMEHLGVANEPA